MNGTRLSVCFPGADARAVVNASILADRNNVDVWIGSPIPSGVTSDDSYVTTAAAAVAAVTRDTRIGVFLSLRGSAEPIRLSEDIGVVDQASQGRIELGLVMPDDGLDEWESDARVLLTAWHSVPAGPDRTVATTPRPAQPWVSRLVSGPVGPARAVADRLRGGVIVDGNATAASSAAAELAPRTVLTVRPPDGADGVADWLASDPVGVISELRVEVDRHGAHEVLVVVNHEDRRLVSDMAALGTVIAPAIRSSAHHMDLLAHDGWRWLTELRQLHDAPT